jgi:radical SAM superfamily enzyme YgiQ (UPF0313 family)
MDVLLTHGYYLQRDMHELKVMKPYPPLGILYISAYLKRLGFNVGLFDSTFRSPQDFDALLDGQRPPVVGISCNLMTKPTVLDMVRSCKRAEAIVVVGGPEPAHYAEEYLQHGADVVVVGEGELALAELLPVLQRRGVDSLDDVPGVVFRRNGAVVRTPARPFVADLDSLPWPDRSGIDMRPYLDTWRSHHGVSSVSLITARGCPFTCRWCSHSVYGFTHRRRSVQDVAAEVEWLVEHYRPDMLWYADDVFTIHRRWFLAYATELKRRSLRIPFECISRADCMNEEVVQTLAEMGCWRLWIGSESGSQRVLDAMDRKAKVEEIRHKLGLLRRYGIQTGLFIMLGYESETLDDIQATVEHLKRTRPDTFLTTVAYPIKGTPYYADVEARLISMLPWEQRTDRDLSVAGRHSKRYYAFATRWMVNEVALHRLTTSPQAARGPQLWIRLARAFLNARLGWLGVLLTRRQVEGARAQGTLPGSSGLWA